MKTRLTSWYLIGATLLLSSALQAGTMVVGGFDASRGGVGSIATNAALQSLIDAQFPGTTFSSTATLTSSYLSTINDLIISVATSCCSATAPLSSAEQAALVSFVESGGTALLLTDNSTFDANAPTVNNSFVSPFGLSTAGTLRFGQPSTIVDGSSPVVTGPAGTATGFDTDFPGWFSSLGSAQEIAKLTANGEPDIASLLPGALGPGSGAVVFFADGNNVGGGGGAADTNDDILILNSLALHAAPVVTPEPGSFLLLALGMFGGLGALWVERRRQASIR